LSPPSTPRSNRHSARGTVGTSSPAPSFTGGFRTTARVHAEPSRWAVIRGRDGCCQPPPAQIRTSPIRAYGSYLEYLTAKRCCGHG
jgi:hypothetical protein